MHDRKTSGRRVGRRIVAMGGLLGALVGAFGIASTGGAQSSAVVDTAVAGGQISDSKVANVEDYWTPAKMRNAKPAPMPGGDSHSASSDEQVGPSDPLGPPGATPPGGPDGNGVGEADMSVSAPFAADEPAHSSHHAPGAFLRWNWQGRYRTYPMSTVGRVFFTQGGSNRSCSAAMVKGGAGTAGAWTAGHCISNGAGTLHSNVQFCPSYDNGVNPAVGCWAADELWLTTDFHNNGGCEADMGVIGTAPTGTVHNTEAHNITSWLGLTWNRVREQTWMALGYPALDSRGGPAFNGNKITAAFSSFMYLDDFSPSASRPRMSAMGNDMTGGSSGGPWLVDLNSAVAASYPNYINGHNNCKHFSTAINEMTSPYLDDRAKAVWDAL